MKYTIKRKRNQKTLRRKTKYTKKMKKRIFKRTRKGGYKFLENLNLDKYAKDPEIQYALQVYFNERVDDARKAKEILIANKNLYPSIKDLIKQIGVGTLTKGDRWDDYTSADLQPIRDMDEIDRMVSMKMSELELEKQRRKRDTFLLNQEKKSVTPSRVIRQVYKPPSYSYNSSNRQQ